MTAAQVVLAFAARRWWVVKRTDRRALDLVDGMGIFAGLGPHYSRQTVGAAEFMSSGKTLVMLTDCERAVWGVIENRVPGGGERRWRCSMFRNEGAGRSSDLISQATALTFTYWERRYGGLPSVPLTTEIDPAKVRRKRDPGRCFLKAGWLKVREHRGFVVLQAPDKGGASLTSRRELDGEDSR